MADTTPRLLSERTNFRVVIGSAGVGVLGLLLLWLSTDDNWWNGRELWWLSGKNLQSTINSCGALLIATVPVTLFWEMSGKRRFLDEVLAKARIAKELEDAGFTNAYDSFQRIVEWEHFFQNANEIDIFFVYGHSWRSNNRELIRQFLLRRHSRLRVILPDPEDATTVGELARQFGYTEQNTRDRIVEAFNDFRDLAPHGRKLEIYYFGGMTPHLSFYRFGAVSVFCPYNHSAARAPVPAFVVRDGGFLFGYLRDEFTVIREHSKLVFPEDTDGK